MPQPKSKKKINELDEEIKNKINDLDRSISDIKDFAVSLGRKIDSNESILANINSSLIDVLKEEEVNKKEPWKDEIIPAVKNQDSQDSTARFDKKFDAVKNEITSLQNDMSVLQGNLMVLEQNLSKTGLSNMKQKFASLQNEINAVKSVKSDDKTSELVDIVKEMEQRIASLETPTSLESQLSEIVNRLVFLESRVSAIERMMQDIPRYSPIVVE